MADYGLLKLRLPDGRNISVRGSVTEIASNVSAEAIVNHDNSIDRSFTARGYEFSISFAARDQSGALIDVESIIHSGPMSVSLISEKEKAIRTYSRAVATGEASVDLMTGEVTGLVFKAQGRSVNDV